MKKNKTISFIQTENRITFIAMVSMLLVYLWVGFEIAVMAALSIIIGRVFFTTKSDS